MASKLTDPILAAFDRRRQRCPEAPLLISGRHEVSVEEIDALARTVGARLEEGEVRAGAMVGLVAPNGAGFLAGLLAIRRARSAALLFDERTPEAERSRVARALGVAAILQCHRVRPQTADDLSLLRSAHGTKEAATSLPPEIAVVKLTSGSTGRPRGILTPSIALVADDEALAATMGLVANERILAAIPMSHSYGLSSVVMPALMRESVLVLPRADNPFDPLIVARSRRATFFPTVPSYLQALIRMSSPPRAPSSLRLIVSAGAPLKPVTAVRFREIYDRPVHVFYGASECGGISFDRTGTAGERGSLGLPVQGVRITLEPLGEGEPGDRGTVTVTSPAVAQAYLPDTDPCLAGGRFRTCDVASLRDGELFLEGRLDDLVIVRGKNVNPREVETVLSQLEGVEEVVTLGVPVPGQEDRILRSFIACRPGHLTCETVQTWCRRHLAEYKVPRSVVLLEEIPRTDRGKLDRIALLGLEPGNQGSERDHG